MALSKPTFYVCGGCYSAIEKNGNCPCGNVTTSKITPLVAVCVCGHSCDWHSSGGNGDCEHDGECKCQAFSSAVVR